MPLDASKIVNDAKSTSTRLESFLEEAIATRNELNRQLSNARRRLDTKLNSQFYPNKLAKEALNIVKQEASSILMQQIDTATEGSVEFSNPIYKTMLYKVAADNSIYKMITSGSGWETKLSPQIVFEEEAGDIADYSRGITIYRTVLRTLVGKQGTDRGLKATNWWFSKIYGTTRYDKTVEERVRLSSREAPFWRLLDAGSVGLPSDRPDGSFNPIITQPTGFIDKAERAIKSRFTEIMLPETIKWAEEAKGLRQFIDDTVEERDRVSDEIRNLRFDVRENQRIFESFGKLKEFVDKDKLAEAVRKFRADPESERRISVSTKGSRRVFLTARRLEGFIDY